MRLVPARCRAAVITLSWLTGLALCLAPLASEAEPVTSGPLATVVQRRLDQHNRQLDNVEAAIAQSKFARARESLASLTTELANTRDWNKDKVSPDHPALKAIDERLAALQVSLSAKAARAEAESAAITPVVEAIKESIAPIENAAKEGRFALMGLSSLESDYSQYRNQKKIDDTLATLRDTVAAANSLMPPAADLVTHFKQQYPSEDALKAVLPDDAPRILETVQRLAREIDAWAEQKDQAAATITTEAETSIKEAAAKLQSKTRADQLSAVESARMWAINYYGPLLDAVDILYPVNEQNADSVLALTQAQQQTLAKAHQLQQEIAGLEKTIASRQKARAAAQQQRLGDARFPQGTRALSTHKDEVLKVLTAEFGKPLRTGVYADWQSRREARWLRDHWDVAVFNYLGVWVAARTPAGKHRVYRTTVRQRRQADGAWGPVTYWSVGESYELLPGNIDK